MLEKEGSNEYVDPEFIEKTIIKSMLEDKPFGILVTNKFEFDYFETEAASILFDNIKFYIEKYKDLPSQEILINTIKDEKEKEKSKSYLEEINAIEFRPEKNQEWLYENANNYLRDRALKTAIMKSIDIINNNGDGNKVKNIVEEAICKDLKIDLGLNYFDELNKRLERILYTTDIKVPSCYDFIDDLITGGFPAYTLSVWAAVTHGGKSLLLANMLSRQVLKGYTGVLFTMEMSQDAFAQRFDAIYSYLDINKMYIQSRLKNKLVKNLKEVKNTEGRRDLYIKEFPTGKAKVNDFRIYLKELELRGIKPDIIYCDYINIMAPSSNKKGSNKYEDITEIVRELRALSLEFRAPVVSVTQINRDGSYLDLKELNWNYIAECISIANDSDFVGILGHDPDKLQYESEIHYKIAKNRLGGRVGTIGKLYMDQRNLRLYDETEYEKWFEDAKISGDERNPAEEE
ncbi:MAG: DnaB-like helicase C-terminal domain-containing protein [archaeon]